MGTKPRPRRRTSLGLTADLKVKLTPGMLAQLRTVADLRELSDAEVVRRALAEYLPGEVKRARGTVKKRQDRTGGRNVET